MLWPLLQAACLLLMDSAIKIAPLCWVF